MKTKVNPRSKLSLNRFPKLKEQLKPRAAARAPVVPGQIIVIVEGKLAGKRVIVLKTFSNGTVAVAGPSNSSNVPALLIRRSSLVATVKTLSLSETAFDFSVLTTADLKSPTPESDTKRKFMQKALNSETPQQIDLRKRIDSALIESVAKTDEADLSTEYLGTLFSLKKGDVLHEMRF